MSPRDLQSAWREAREWLFDAALPLWAEAGVDPAGGFHDQIGDDRRPVDAPKRLRVQGRQILVYAEAERLGWGGPWREVIEHGLAFFERQAPGESGLYASTFENGRAAGEETYDQAFVLLGLAHARRALDRAGLEAPALELLAAMRRRLGRPGGGFGEVVGGDAPLQANPHMHLYETAMTWRALSGDPAWGALAADMRRLGLEVFIDRASGRLLEFFKVDGSPADGPAGREVWPGHMFEWAAFFMLDGRRDDAVAERLARLATETGVDRKREVAIFSQDVADGAPIDASARLWSQTERLRACLFLRGRTDDPGYWTDEALKAYGALQKYLAVPGNGLWRDRIAVDGSLDSEPAKASSLYHIVGAYAALKDAADGVI